MTHNKTDLTIYLNWPSLRGTGRAAGHAVRRCGPASGSRMANRSDGLRPMRSPSGNQTGPGGGCRRTCRVDVVERLGDLGLGVHHERPAHRDRLGARPGLWSREPGRYRALPALRRADACGPLTAADSAALRARGSWSWRYADRGILYSLSAVGYALKRPDPVSLLAYRTA